MAPEMVRWSISETAPKISTKKISPVELVQAYLDGIGEIDDKLSSFITVTGDLAIEQAKRAEKEILSGSYRGPLHGIPLALKDIINTAGVRTTAGSRILAENIPAKNAAVWQKLSESGSVLIGKTNMHEFARGSSTNNPHYGRCRNPWDIEGKRIPGGSSGGSGAAVAACLCAGALGTDTLGSVRKPAADCGIVGIKPTYDLVSRQGVIPLSWSLDHVGPMARTVKDAAILLYHMMDADHERLRQNILPSPDFQPKGIRIGLINDWWNARCDPEVSATFQKALAAFNEMGCEIRELDFADMERVFAAGRIVSICEATTYHEPWIREQADAYGEDVRRALIGGFTIPARDYIHCLRVRSWAIDKFNTLFEQADLIASPCTMEPAPDLDGIKTEKGLDIAFYTGPANLLGIPALSVPCGFSTNGIPIGLQLMASHYQEGLAINLAKAYEAVAPWHQRRPPICA